MTMMFPHSTFPMHTGYAAGFPQQTMPGYSGWHAPQHVMRPHMTTFGAPTMNMGFPHPTALSHAPSSPTSIPPTSPNTFLPVVPKPVDLAVIPHIPFSAEAAPKEVQELILSRIRNYKDFPKPGILFRDITTLIRDADALRFTIDLLAQRYKDQGVKYFVGVESRGFVFATALAVALGVGCVLLRKPGKLPGETRSCKYKLEYGEAELCLQHDAVEKGDKVVVVDDLLATGGTLTAGVRVLEEAGADVLESCVIIELLDLKGRENLGKSRVFALAQCHEE